MLREEVKQVHEIAKEEAGKLIGEKLAVLDDLLNKIKALEIALGELKSKEIVEKAVAKDRKETRNGNQL